MKQILICYLPKRCIDQDCDVKGMQKVLIFRRNNYINEFLNDFTSYYHCILKTKAIFYTIIYIIIKYFFIIDSFVGLGYIKEYILVYMLFGYIAVNWTTIYACVLCICMCSDRNYSNTCM